MSSNNDSSGPIIAIAFVGAIAAVMFALVFAAAAFLTAFITVVCLCAWNKPLTWFGQTITPQEARSFVGRGVLGAILLPSFALFASALYNVRLNPDYFGYFPLGGYVFGSLVVGYWIEQAEEERAAQMSLLAATSSRINTIENDSIDEQKPEPAPFRFASWDDEEELRP